jgi:hypothetical protein
MVVVVVLNASPSLTALLCPSGPLWPMSASPKYLLLENFIATKIPIKRMDK